MARNALLIGSLGYAASMSPFADEDLNGGCTDGDVVATPACGYNCDENCNCGHCNTKPGCMSEDTCLGPCNSGGNAKWCPAVGPPSPTPAPTPPPPTPPPSPTPSPTPSDCPGGSLDACIDLCPPDVFEACVKGCQRRCPSPTPSPSPSPVPTPPAPTPPAPTPPAPTPPAPTPFTADLTIKLCDEQGCKASPKRVALDAKSGGTQHLISVGGQGDELTLKYGNSDIGGPRVYLIEEEGKNENTMFMLRGQEFTFDVELSTMTCGFNAALYFVGMTANEGGAENGTNYCDAQAVTGTFCSEMDLFEANTVAQQYTTHGCIDACASFTEDVAECKGTFGVPANVCDQSGCGLNPFRYGPGTTYNAEFNNEAWHGFGSGFDIDTSKPFTVTTQFQDASITRFYQQNGKRVDLPTLYVLPPSDGSHYGPFESPELREDYCVDIYDRWNGGKGYKPLAQMFKNMENGMVLAMSAWYAQETYVNGKPGGEQTGMSWLDGVNNWGNHYIKAGPCHESTSDAGEHQATFSNIRFGTIGTTTGAMGATTFV